VREIHAIEKKDKNNYDVKLYETSLSVDLDHEIIQVDGVRGCAYCGLEDGPETMGTPPEDYKDYLHLGKILFKHSDILEPFINGTRPKK
jgi:hypothetical protein